MAIPVAGYLGKVLFSSTVNPPVVVVGFVKSCDVPIEREKIDVTAVGQTSVGGESSIAGKFKGNEFNLECYKVSADAGQLDLQNTLMTGTCQGYMIVQDNPAAAAGSRGFGFRCFIAGIPTGVSEEGTPMVKFKVSIQDKVVLDNGTIPTIPT